MKKWNNYDETKVIREQEKLPVGAYKVKVLEAKEITYSNGNGALQVSFDICEGDYKDFFGNQYANSTFDDKKWKGVHRINIPKDDGSESDGWTKSSFKRDIVAFEESNPDFHWDWEEKKLKGLIVGAVFYEKEWAYNGKEGYATLCHHFINIEDLENEKFKIPPVKKLDKKKNAEDDPFAGLTPPPADDDDLPF